MMIVLRGLSNNDINHIFLVILNSDNKLYIDLHEMFRIILLSFLRKHEK